MQMQTKRVHRLTHMSVHLHFAKTNILHPVLPSENTIWYTQLIHGLATVPQLLDGFFSKK